MISGINLGRWGREHGKQNRLAESVRAILDEHRLEQLRLSSVEPMDLSDDLLELVASSPRIAKHATRRCNRVATRSAPHASQVSSAALRRALRKARALMPDAAIGADVMVGFPGETDEEFEESRAFIADRCRSLICTCSLIPRARGHRQQRCGSSSSAGARERNRILRELAAEKNLEFRRSFVGKTIAAITLHRSNESHTEALTDNFLKMSLEGKHGPNQWVNAHVASVAAEGLLARSV